MSIAFANLIRALYINVFNFASLLALLKRSGIKIQYLKSHFKKFIKIFSFTSASRIITGLSNSLDMVVLARFISPNMITLYEINKRPINLTNTLIGRHSVALMPLISHTKGTEDHTAIINLINKQFRLYIYAAIFAAFMFVINYFDLITLWVGEGKFIGNNLLYLLIIFNFATLISYFMSNVGYALGDIKRNSQYLIFRNIFYGVLVFFAAKYFGITGTIIVSLSMSLIFDFFFFSYRVYKLGYLKNSLIRAVGTTLAICIPLSILVCWFIKSVLSKLIPENLYLTKMLYGSGVFTLFFVALILTIDSNLRSDLKVIKTKLFLRFA